MEKFILINYKITIPHLWHIALSWLQASSNHLFCNFNS